MLDKAITREGILIMMGGHVYLEGWETNDGMCREVAALACLYAARELMERGMALIAQPGGDKRTCIGLPDGAPKDWEYHGDPDDTWMDEQDEMRVAEQQSGVQSKEPARCSECRKPIWPSAGDPICTCGTDNQT